MAKRKGKSNAISASELPDKGGNVLVTPVSAAPGKKVYRAGKQPPQGYNIYDEPAAPADEAPKG